MKALFTQATMFALTVLVSAGAYASVTPGLCEINEDGNTLYKGRCLVDTQVSAPTTSLVVLSGDDFAKALGVASLTINEELLNVATIEANKTNGSLTTWGEAKRTPLNSPCWVGEHNRFKVCVW